MGERRPEELCAQACEHLCRQEYERALHCCDEAVAALPNISPFPTSTPSDEAVRLQASLYRISALLQLKKYSEAEEDCKSVLCIHEVLRDGLLRDVLVTMLLEGRLKEVYHALYNCEGVDCVNGESMQTFRQLLLLLTETQVSSNAARVSPEPVNQGIHIDHRWKYRPPPRGVLGLDEYTICCRFLQYGSCHYGVLCLFAHSHGELVEWRERHVYRRLQDQQTREELQHCGSYGENLIEKWISNPSPDKVVSGSVDGVTVDCVPELNQVAKDKKCTLSWMLLLNCNPPRLLHRVALLSDLHRSHFSISSVAAGCSDSLHPYSISEQCQEWSRDLSGQNRIKEHVYQVTVRFCTEIFGNFQQTVVFDFGTEPVLMQTVSAAVSLDEDVEAIFHQQQQSLLLSQRWDPTCKHIAVVEFQPRELSDLDQSLLLNYEIPAAADQLFTRSVLDKSLNMHNYYSRFHDLLYIEENAQSKEVSKFNIQASLHIVSGSSVPGHPGSARQLLNGQLFAILNLSGTVITRDTAAGRLVTDTVTSVLLMPVGRRKGPCPAPGSKEKVYEALLEDRSREYLLLRLAKECCEDLKLQPDKDLLVELQFQLNRLPLCEMHYALDTFQDCSLLFPDLSTVVLPPPLNSDDGLEMRLNPRQREAIQAIAAPLSLRLPPLIITGPSGTGKTFTLIQAVKLLLRDTKCRILLCTHSEPAADIFVKDHLNFHDGPGLPEGWLLRIHNKNKPVKSVLPAVQRFSLITRSRTSFLLPTKEDVVKSRLVVTTVSLSKHLTQLGLGIGYFTHILLDEASYATECESLLALALADESTRVVLAGDPAQLAPVVYSEFARERSLHVSLIERLSQFYPPDSCCRIELSAHYRSQETIINLASELFYGGDLRAASKQPAHKEFFPLSFFAAWGMDKNCYSYYNFAEVLEIAEQVEELQKKWPVAWGKLDENSIGVVTPYASQAVCIRAELHKRKLQDVTVEQILNVQGRHFRVLFLSTVRTRHTYKEPSAVVKRKDQQQEETAEDLEYGFLSSSRMLSTVLPRAQSLLAVVGDPVALCTIGKCRKIWERIILLCHERGSLHGVALHEIHTQLDNLELSRSCVLNPLAPEFIPRTLLHPAFSRRLQASFPRLSARRPQFQRFKPPGQAEVYGHNSPAGLVGSPVCSFQFPSGRHSIFGKSASPLQRSDPQGRNNIVCVPPYRSRFVMPVPVPCSGYQNRLPLDPRIMACQAAVAYNINLLQNQGRLSPGPFVSGPLSPHQTYQSSIDGSVEHSKTGREEMLPGFETVKLWKENEMKEKYLANLDSLGGSPFWLSEGQMDRSSAPKFGHSAKPYFNSSFSEVKSHHSFSPQGLHSPSRFPGNPSMDGLPYSLDRTPLPFASSPEPCRSPLLGRMEHIRRSPSPAPLLPHLSPGLSSPGVTAPQGSPQTNLQNDTHVNSAMRENVQSSDRCISKFSQWMEQCGDLVNDHPNHHHHHHSVPQSLNMHSPLVQNHDVFRLSSQHDANHIDSYHGDPNLSVHESFEQHAPWNDPRTTAQSAEISPKVKLFPYCSSSTRPLSPLPSPMCYERSLKRISHFGKLEHGPSPYTPDHKQKLFHFPNYPLPEFGSAVHSNSPHLPSSVSPVSARMLLQPPLNTHNVVTVIGADLGSAQHGDPHCHHERDFYASPKQFQRESEIDVRTVGRPLYQRGFPSTLQESPSSQASQEPSPFCSPDLLSPASTGGQRAVEETEDSAFSPMESSEGQAALHAQDCADYNRQYTPSSQQAHPDCLEGSEQFYLDENKTAASYASVLRAPPPSSPGPSPELPKKANDPLTLLQDLSKRSGHSDSGFYSYFQ
ncbi:probable helicase with zinc finger domain [Acipenser ruthenus]|uniref:probable helicase with zinc finger domain n=1 Tax=Acipenser ruthenus TaxID=7906 RepID=UPI0027418DDA|nr:probable helicase with zinc finger domain [Acipenser ruthenus]XP_058891478.1 probable helicase with zinc finger domain [Acipenser ruthenus]